MLAWQQMNPMALFGDPSNHTIPISPLCSGQAIRNQSEPPQTMFLCNRTPDRYWGIQLMSCITLGRPLRPITHPFRAVKAQGSSRQICYDPLGLGSDKAQFRKHTEVCVWPIYRYRAIKRPQLTLDREVLYRDCTRLKKIHWCPVSLMKETNYTWTSVMTGLRWESVVLHYWDD